MFKITSGNLLDAPVEALVNTVNTEGVMGKGIALQFKQAFPTMFKAYELACKAKEVRLGKVHLYDLGGLVGGPQWIVNFPTKGHWKSKSRLIDIEAGLADLVIQVQALGIRSIAVPPLGCGYGGLDWADVEPLIRAAFTDLPNVEVHMYPPGNTPSASDMKIGTDRPKITPGRAALISVFDRYKKGHLAPDIQLLEVHKLMYFLQEAGQPLRLRYEPRAFGPYALNLRQVLIQLEGHYIQGYGAGSDNPKTKIDLMEGAVEEAATLVNADPDTVARIDRVATLIQGFEDPYGLELLSSVHWVMCHAPNARESAEATVNAVHAWNDRKRRMLKREHLEYAWERLTSEGWDIKSRSALH
ncbi:macro domain protein [Janthinobacterium sp. HH106]|uniref:type II toxin-antitoxin system antitoxin DNA ADP-ribosyl glycohydrolase DarG n=1 Tax=Janthinobacterium sp. HH106 TaxID=1537278 RepID=UPI00089340AD|nr:macro domain-containing protein [Janthinobacterium sp. HH106]OEZ80827.1 macro domain protein [Janthinobacterium sp. HH106]